jgi:hypothetical protein
MDAPVGARETTMTLRAWCIGLATAAAATWAGTAGAVTCYVVMDRNDNVIYQSSVPPVDMSEQGAAARERMRQRGEYLMFGDYESCPGVAFFTGAGGNKALALDEVVNGMPARGAARMPAPTAGAAPR